VNRLPASKRSRIVQLHEAGHTVREIAAEVGVHRESVEFYSLSGYRHRIGKMVLAVFQELEDRNIDPIDVSSLMDLDNVVNWSCPVHPELNRLESDLQPDDPCPLCVRDGLVRHHERRKAEGRPIVPPWARKREQKPEPPASVAFASGLTAHLQDQADESMARVRVPPPKPIRIIPQVAPVAVNKHNRLRV